MFLLAASAPPPFPAWVFPAAFPVMFICVSWVLSRLSGWRRLADSYRAVGAPPESKRHFVSGRMGAVNFNGALVVGGDERGLYLVPFFLLRAFHPPLCIPWSELRDRESRSAFFIKRDTFVVGLEGIRLQLHPSATKPFEGYLSAVRRPRG